MCLTERLFSASSEGETERWRDREAERLGDRGTEGWRDGGTTLFFLLRDEFDAIGFCLDLTLIPHPVTPSLYLSVSLSLCLPLLRRPPQRELITLLAAFGAVVDTHDGGVTVRG